MSEPVQTSTDGPVEKPANTTDADSQENLTSGPIEPGEDAKEIEAAKQRRYAAQGDTVQGDGEPVNFGSAPVTK